MDPSRSERARSAGAGRMRRVVLPALFAAAALLPAIALRGFLVDDALITARYAANLASGAGYRLSPGGPVTDGVTPLGFAYLLAPFARGGVLAAFHAAKGIGVVAWTVAAAVMGMAVARRCAAPLERGLDPANTGGDPRHTGVPTPPRSRRALWLVPFALVATSAPLGAWAVAGMETGLVTALGALAAALPLLDRAAAGMLCAGLAAGLRPELLPWAGTLALGVFFAPLPPPASAGASTSGSAGASTSESAGASTTGAVPASTTGSTGASTSGSVPASTTGSTGASTTASTATVPTRPRRSVLPLILALTPFALAATVRLIAFGRPAPLSVFAKSPDARLGLYYAAACALLTGPVVLLAPRALARLDTFGRALVASVLVHFLAVAAAGGDWMPLSRLVVPVLPSLALAALLVAERAHLLATAARLALAVAGQTFVLVHIGPTAAAVGADRLRVLDELRPALAPARVVASLDIGWVGAATSATIVDLAGITDPAIAALPGGHTTRQIPAGLLDSRRADTLVLLLAPNQPLADPWTRSRFARGVEAWIATTPGIADTFTPVAESSLPHLRYVVLRRVDTSGPSPPP